MPPFGQQSESDGILSNPSAGVTQVQVGAF